MKTKINADPQLIVLSLEDSFRDFEIIRESLTDAGYDLTMDHAENEAQFISFLQKQKYDMILADFSLPGYDAFAALEKSLEIAPDVPLIVVSGSIGEETAIDLIRQGAVDYVLKDRLERLPFAVKRALEEAKQKEARKQAEQDLADNHTLLCIAGETAKFGGWSVDLQTNICIWSHTVADIHEMPRGYSPLLKEGINFYAPEWRERITAVFTDCAQKGIPYDEEMEILTKTGKQVWVRTNGVAVRNETGRIIKIQGAFQDISERKRADAEREKLISAIEQASDTIMITDTDGIIQYVNPTFETVTGYSRKEILGQNAKILKSDKQDQAFYRHLRATVAEGDTFRGRMVNKRKDGTLFTEDATISPVLGAQGKIVNYVAVKRDVTAHIQLEAQLQQAQKMESVGRLAGGVAHDFNNMLTIILSYTQLAMNELDPAGPIHDDLQQVLKAAQRSADITRQLLAFARKQTISPQVLDFNRTVEYMLKMLRRLMGEDIHLTWQPGSGLWPVKMDPSQMDQILANLCVNARDAIAGVGTLTLETDNVTLDGDYCAAHPGFVPGDFVLLAVSDTGCGMDRQILDHIFEPFFTTKGLGQGTGLGLAMVYGIIKQNDGFINVYSEPGQGTCLRIYLPRHTGEPEQSKLQDETEIPAGHHETVLIIEDDRPILNLAKRMLEGLDYDVLEAETPGEALDLAQTHTGGIDLVLIDVIMPEMTGPDLAKKLKALYPDLKLLFMSGYTADIIAQRGLLAADTNFISKPFSIKELALKVRETLDHDPV